MAEARRPWRRRRQLPDRHLLGVTLELRDRRDAGEIAEQDFLADLEERLRPGLGTYGDVTLVSVSSVAGRLSAPGGHLQGHRLLSPRRPWWPRLARDAALALAVLAALTAFALAVLTTHVEGGSMSPSIHDGDLLLVDRLGVLFATGVSLAPLSLHQAVWRRTGSEAR